MKRVFSIILGFLTAFSLAGFSAPSVFADLEASVTPTQAQMVFAPAIKGADILTSAPTPAPEFAPEPTPASDDDATEVEPDTKEITDTKTPLMASPVSEGGSFGAANAGAAAASVAVSVAALYNLRKQAPLKVATSSGTMLRMLGFIGIGLGVISVAMLLLTQDIFSAGTSGASAANELTPVFGAIMVLQVVCLAVPLVNKFVAQRVKAKANSTSDSDPKKHPRFKTRF